MGLKNYNITRKTGCVVAAKVVTADDDIMIISDDGTMIRTWSNDVAKYGRATMGVRVMRVSDGAKVISVTPMSKDVDDEGGENSENSAPETSEQ
jgi:DNA gyrase subunit A